VLHFDTLGYVLVCTTLVSLTLMYVMIALSESPTRSDEMRDGRSWAHIVRR